MNRTQIHSPTPEDEANSSRLSEIFSVAPEVPCRPFKRIPEDRHSTVRGSHRTPSKCSSTTQCKVFKRQSRITRWIKFHGQFYVQGFGCFKGKWNKQLLFYQDRQIFARQCQRLSCCTKMLLMCISYNFHECHTAFRIADCSRTITHQSWSNLKHKLHTFE
jgi:hypothetical protein